MEHLQQMLQGLLAETDYDAYIRSDCGGGDKSDWSNAVSFTTTCTPFTAPYSENFDSVSEPGIPDCWSRAGNDASEVATENSIRSQMTHHQVPIL